ncbi:MAG: HDOD domain-containing protein [Ectothiorhodospiraceae bacterium]|nr:HDOD domain-containing protein [Ectothiorhodospiraceae bacterium]
MSTSITVRRYLETQDVRFTIITCPVDAEGRWQGDVGEISPSCVARAMILKDSSGMVMAVLPITHRLKLDALNRQLHRKLLQAEEIDYRGVFADCSPGILPALGEAYSFETVIDDSLLDQDYVYIASGNAGELIQITGQDFQLLHSNAWYGNTFSQIAEKRPTQKPADLKYQQQIKQQAERKVKKVVEVVEKKPAPAAVPVANMRQRIERLTDLPAMPSLAQKIMQLNANPYAHAEDLAKLVEKDPSLTAQIVRYAQSPFYGYQGKVASVRQAISRVLGYDMVMNISLGVAATRPFKVPTEGPLGLHSFWQHATYSAAITQTLCKIIPREKRPQPGTAYLAGLLHNFGFLLLGHLFPKEFSVLHNAVKAEPEVSILELEQRLVGVTHMEMGAWLMDAWNMPKEIVVVQKEHHNVDYDGPHANYVQVVALADRLLKSLAMGDAESEELPESLLQALGITTEQVAKVMEQTIESRDELDTMARQLVA